MVLRTTASLGILMTLLLGCGGSPVPGPTELGELGARRDVEVETVVRELVPRLVTVVGTVHARERVTISNEVPGTVARVHVDFGDTVDAGDLLLEIDRRELELQLGTARATLAQAEAERVRAHAAWQRAQQLYPQEVISKERLDAVQASFRVAEASREVAAKRLALAEKKLDDATVRAPFRAAVQARLVTAGQYVPAYTALFELVDSERVKFRGEVPERFAPRLREGVAVTLEVESRPGETFEGTVTRVGSALNATTRSLPFESELANPTAKLTPGMFGRVRLALDPEPMLLMPRAALVEFAGVNRAFVVRDGHVESRPLDIGDLIDDRIEVVAGLAAGDDVVTAEQERLEDGMAVRSTGDRHR
jgi:membrane fusion protein (multidrug efflux system)